MNPSHAFRKIGFKGIFVFLYWLLLLLGYLGGTFLPSFAECGGDILNLCFPYGFMLIGILTYPAIAILQNYVPIGATSFLPISIVPATFLYFCIGLAIDILRGHYTRRSI